MNGGSTAEYLYLLSSCCVHTCPVAILFESRKQEIRYVDSDFLERSTSVRIAGRKLGSEILELWFQELIFRNLYPEFRLLATVVSSDD